MRPRQFTIAAKPVEIAERDLGFGRDLGGSRVQAQVARFLQDADDVDIGRPQEERPSVAQEELSAPRMIVRPKLDGALVELGCRPECAQEVGAIARLAQSLARALGDPVDGLARGASELERARVVVREHLRAVFAVGGQSFDPLGRSAMFLRSLRARHLSIGDVTDEHVPERILRLGRNG